jgi:hypothetical protein
MSCIELFGNLTSSPTLRHYHPFECSTYVLNTSSQISEWEPKADVGKRLSKITQYIDFQIIFRVGMYSSKTGK